MTAGMRLLTIFFFIFTLVGSNNITATTLDVNSKFSIFSRARLWDISS